MPLKIRQRMLKTPPRMGTNGILCLLRSAKTVLPSRYVLMKKLRNTTAEFNRLYLRFEAAIKYIEPR